MLKEKFFVLDVEGNSNCLPYNIGYIIADNVGKIYQERNVALPYAVWQNLMSCLKSGICEEMHLKNSKEIMEDFENEKRKYNCLSIEGFWKLFTHDIKHYKIKKLYAYNITFDNAALSRLFGQRYHDLKLENRDIMAGCVRTKLLNPKYLLYCDQNGYLTEKGNYKYGAEIVYRYLMGEAYRDFVEEHTGLADVHIEYEILLWVLKSRKKVNWKCGCGWKMFQKYVEDTGYERRYPF